MHMHVYLHMYMSSICILYMHVCMYVCIYLSIYLSIYIYIFIHNIPFMWSLGPYPGDSYMNPAQKRRSRPRSSLKHLAGPRQRLKQVKGSLQSTENSKKWGPKKGAHWRSRVLTANSKKWEHGCRVIYAGFPSFFGLGLLDGRVPTFWLLV